MEIKNIKVEDLKQYKKNAKLHPEWQIKQIAESISKFGFNDPIAIDENNVIIEGHGRFLACKLLEMEEVPTIRLDHMTEQEKKAYILAHNKINLNTGFDFDVLKEELSGIDDLITGFSDFELENILSVSDENDVLDIEEFDEDLGNDKTINGLVCPECKGKFEKKLFLACDLNG